MPHTAISHAKYNHIACAAITVAAAQHRMCTSAVIQHVFLDIATKQSEIVKVWYGHVYLVVVIVVCRIPFSGNPFCRRWCLLTSLQTGTWQCHLKAMVTYTHPFRERYCINANMW